MILDNDASPKSRNIYDRNTNLPENRVTMSFAGSMPTLTVILTTNIYWLWSPPQTGQSSMRDKPDKIMCIQARSTANTRRSANANVMQG